MPATTLQNTQVTQLYAALFDRAPDADGLGYWANQLAGGKTMTQLGVDMYNVSAARAYYPLSLSNDQIVDTFYLNVLGRAADAAGKAYWSTELATKSVGHVISNMIVAVVNYSGTDPAGLASQSLFNNKVVVGEHFAETLGSNDITLANNALKIVTSDAASVTTAEAANTAAVTPASVHAYTLTADAPSVTEGNSGTTSLTFTLALDRAPTEAVTVNYATGTTGTATSGVDFDAAAGAVTFAVGQTTATASATVNGDTTVEANETVIVQFSGTKLAAAVTGTGTITNDDVAATSLPQTFTLTPAADTGAAFTGTAANDTFSGTYDAAVTDTFGATDALNGGGGTDTLKISHFFDVAITPPDALWTGIRGIEKIVIDTTGNGAQTITTGAQFEAAFHGNGVTGVDLTTTTTGTGAITIDMTSFGGTATLTPTSIAGAQAITTGSGAATVTAASGAGALTIMGVGLETVSATTTGDGAQTIGDAGGNGANLVTVTATSNSGAQTITSTSTSPVTVTATSTSGPQTIETGTGADSVTANSAAGTNNTITTNAGNDAIVAGLGNDLITGGLGADSMTGGGGADTFAFGANGSVIGTAMDTISDFNTAGTDVLNFGATTTVPVADASALVAGSNVQTSAGGLMSFHASDNSLALKIIAIQADAQLDTAGTVAMFVDGANTYVYYAGTATGNADDQLIQLTGIHTLVAITGGATTTIV